MNDSRLAQELVNRLNALLTNEDTRADIQSLLDRRVPCSDATVAHPTIQVDGLTFGFLGLLNGVVGVKPGGSSGYVAAVYDDSGKLTKFEALLA